MKEHGLIFAKMLLTFGLAAVPAFGISLVQKLGGWYIDNQVYMALVFLALAIDHALGTFVHFQIKQDFSMKKNLGGLLRKGFTTCAGYVLFEMIHQIVRDVDFIGMYFKVIIQLSVIIYPVFSGLKNLSIISNGSFPPKIWFTKFESFNNDLDLEHFKTTKNEETTDTVPDPGAAGMQEPDAGEDGGNIE